MALLVMAMSGFTLGNLLAAVAPTHAGVLAARTPVAQMIISTGQESPLVSTMALGSTRQFIGGVVSLRPAPPRSPGVRTMRMRRCTLLIYEFNVRLG